MTPGSVLLFNLHIPAGVVPSNISMDCVEVLQPRQRGNLVLFEWQATRNPDVNSGSFEVKVGFTLCGQDKYTGIWECKMS